MTKLLDFMHEFPLGFGGAAISGEGKGYGFGAISENEAIGLLELAHDIGFRLFDTAPIYGHGYSEERIGKAFSKKQDEVFIVSKSGVSWHEDSLRVNMTNDPKETQKMLDESLKRLQFDTIDLYMIHWPDDKVDIRRPMEVLAKAKDQNKIKHIGLCNTNLEEIEKASEIEKVEAVQNQLNIFETSVKDELFGYLDQQNISFMSWGTFDKGIITGTVTEDRKFTKEDCRSWAPWWKKSNYKDKVRLMQKLLPELEKDGFSGASLALSFNLSFKALDCALVGARNEKQLLELKEALSKRISPEQMESYLERLK